MTTSLYGRGQACGLRTGGSAGQPSPACLARTRAHAESDGVWLPHPCERVSRVAASWPGAGARRGRPFHRAHARTRVRKVRRAPHPRRSIRRAGAGGEAAGARRGRPFHRAHARTRVRKVRRAPHPRRSIRRAGAGGEAAEDRRRSALRSQALLTAPRPVRWLRRQPAGRFARTRLLSAGSHSAEVDLVDADAGGSPVAGWRGRSPCLLLGLEHDEREAAAVDRL
jgi:hypothetical protein